MEALRFADVLEAEFDALDLAKPSDGATANESDGPTQARLRKLFHRAHANELSAICVSGGGIRSAAIVMGALQALERTQALSSFHYLSSVSGGGFTAGFVAAARATPHDESAPLSDTLGGAGLEHFRRAGRYMAPMMGLTSRDSWRLVLEYVRGALLNALALLPVFVGILALPHLGVHLFMHRGWSGSASRLWLFALVTAAPFSLLVLWWGYQALRNTLEPPERSATIAGAVFVLSAICTISLFGDVFVRSVSTWVVGTGGASLSLFAIIERTKGVSRAVRMVAPVLTPVLGTTFLVAFSSVAAAALVRSGVVDNLAYSLSVVGCAAVAAPLLSWAIHPNKVSLHHFYRSRLAKAFVEPFASSSLKLCDLSQAKRLFHVFNVAVNASSSERTASTTDRRAYPGTMTRLHVGFDHPRDESVGQYCATSDESLSEAMALSGAAVGSGMGFYTSTVYAFVLTLFNARLGLWCPWQRRSTSDGLWGRFYSWCRDLGLWLRVRELLGWHSVKGMVVNVSDGGHFDNLGLYSMLRRRCRYILVIDASADERSQLTELARVVRLARIDLNIDLRMLKLDLDDEVPGPGIYKGVIDYSVDGENVPLGTLVYIRPEVVPQSPLDVRSYAKRFPSFPTEPTPDQFFSEEQLESYRMLGETIVSRTLDVYALHKGLIADEQPKDAASVTTALAETAFNLSRRGVLPTHAGIVAWQDDAEERKVLYVGSSDNSEWVLPKGQIEGSESARAAAVREFEEETGTKIQGRHPEDLLQPGFIDVFDHAGETHRVAYFLLDARHLDRSQRRGFEARPRQWMLVSKTLKVLDLARGSGPSVAAQPNVPDETAPDETEQPTLVPPRGEQRVHELKSVLATDILEPFSVNPLDQRGALQVSAFALDLTQQAASAISMLTREE